MKQLFFIFALITSINTQCPYQCKCPTSLIANCNLLALTTIPTEFDRHVKHLTIAENVLTSLSKTSLKNLGVISLDIFNASTNYISFIDEEAFLGQSTLQLVDLSNNKIQHLESKTFIRNLKFTTLILANNQLEPPAHFLESSSLSTLDLSLNNINQLPPDTFTKCPNLATINLAYNNIASLTFIPTINKFIEINLNNNKFTWPQTHSNITIIMENNPFTTTTIFTNSTSISTLPPSTITSFSFEKIIQLETADSSFIYKYITISLITIFILLLITIIYLSYRLKSQFTVHKNKDYALVSI